MQIGLILELIKISLEVFQGERKGRFLRKYTKLQKEWQDEMALSDDKRSDLALDTILYDCTALAKLIVTEHNK